MQLVYFGGCPHVDATRDALRRALAVCGQPPSFEEVDVDAPGTPPSHRRFGSPAIVVDGVDLFGDGSAAGCACRIYGNGPKSGAPGVAAITAALRARMRRPHWIASVAHLPGALLPLLPAASCPFCVAAYAGVLSSVGLGFLLTERVVVPLIVAFLLTSLASVAWATRGHRKVGPLFATALGSGAVVAGRLVWTFEPAVYAGVVLLVAASLWNLWLKRPNPTPLIRLGSTPSQGTR